MITKIEGVKSNIVNMVDIAKALAGPASYTTKYFGCELGAQSKFDEKTGISLVNGAHDTAKLAGLLKKYVRCHGCGNPETEIIISKNQMITLKCAACGFVSDVDTRDKLTTFVLKNPPEQKKGAKDRKGTPNRSVDAVSTRESEGNQNYYVTQENDKPCRIHGFLDPMDNGPSGCDPMASNVPLSITTWNFLSNFVSRTSST
ncbi:hypothetical protein COCNU_06G008050 [Cocos nucifera]|uniref:Translation initiation factor IF2/IF5 domain-containing protein n=1 Tax=Cocos nucifera TaxID=13894 RepID=A0A8K0IB30_COCNU|nr:hypothetical protein COCNU_06G008050 [Cocos nucifera]